MIGEPLSVTGVVQLIITSLTITAVDGADGFAGPTAQITVAISLRSE